MKKLLIKYNKIIKKNKNKNLQVKELHRLYSVQKKLMNEEKKEISKKSRSWDPRINTSTTSEHMNHSHQFIKWHSPNPTSTQFITANSSAAAGSNFHIHAIREDLNSREQSGSCSGDTVRMPRGFDLQRPASASAADQEDMSAGISATDDDQAAGSSSHRIVLKGNKAMKMMSENDTDEESEVELTLSIGSCLSKNKSKSHKPNQLDSSASLKAHDHHHKGGDCSDPTTPISSSSAPLFDQERKQPHWLFHGLKLK